MNNGFYEFSRGKQETTSSVFPYTGSAIITGSLGITGSLSQGESVIASGSFSHAEGRDTQAIGSFSHAEGDGTQAIGNGSHAEGRSTVASSRGSHAEGAFTTAIGDHSHAEGLATVAAGRYQHVQGQYNISSSAQSAFIHGNGVGENNRSNLIYAHDSVVEITGSLNVTQGITGSLFGTASFASTASFVPGGVTGTGENGQVSFWNGANSQSGDNGLFWDNTNKGLNINCEDDATTRGLAVRQTSSTRAAAPMTFSKSRGTITSPTDVNTNDLVGAFTFSARVGGAFTSDRALFGANMTSTTAMGMFFIAGNTDGNYIPDLYIHPTGNIAIGSSQSILAGITDAGFKLNVNGTARFQGNTVVTGSLTSTATTLLNTLSGNTAIGLATDTSTARLQVRGTGATSATNTLLLQNSSLTNLLTVRDDGSSTLIGILNITPTTSTTSSLVVTGPTLLSGSQNTISGSVLTVVGSGSAQPVFTVQGSQGELFSVTDSLSGSLFSVNDISGLPIMEVFSDGTTLIGNYLDPMLITTTKNTLTNSGSFTIYSLPTASYDTAFFDYSIKSGSNARAGQIMAIQSGSSVNYTETTTMDFGSTTGLSLGVFVSGSNMVLTGSAATTAWVIKTIVRSL
jgi:hypothetical protein